MDSRIDNSQGAAGRPGFTLIEVLVVAAIIALLIAIVIPSLHRARMQARVVQVHSDLRQITAALDAYGMNNKDKLPPTRFACETNVNYQLPVELAQKRYLGKSTSSVRQAEFRDAFNLDRAYKFRAPGPIYQNGALFDCPECRWNPTEQIWEPGWRARAKIWVADDYPRNRSPEGCYYGNYDCEAKSPVTYAVWSVGPDVESPKFPLDGVSGGIDESMFPLPQRFWLMHSGDTGLITHFKDCRTGMIYMSP